MIAVKIFSELYYNNEVITITWLQVASMNKLPKNK